MIMVDGLKILTQIKYIMEEKKNKEEDVTYQLTPKGLLFNSLGGFKNIKLIEDTSKDMYDYMNENNLAIAIIDGDLVFVKNAIKV